MADYISCSMEFDNSPSISTIQNAFIKSGAKILKTGKVRNEFVEVSWSDTNTAQDHIQTHRFSITLLQNKYYLVCSNICRYYDNGSPLSDEIVNILKNIGRVSNLLDAKELEIHTMVGEDDENNERIIKLEDL